MLKPSSAALFAVPWLVRGRFVPVLVATVYLAIASAVVWALTGSNPLEMTGYMLDHGQPLLDQDAGLLALLVSRQWDRQAVLFSFALGGIVFVAVLAWLYRRRSLLVSFAVAAVAGRLWTYHHRYDDCMLIWLLVPLGLLVLRQPTRWTISAFVLVGMTLWMPMAGGVYSARLDFVFTEWRIPFPHYYLLFEIAIWLTGLGIVLANSARLPNEADAGQTQGAASVPRLEITG